jgi:hypothetical protein
MDPPQQPEMMGSAKAVEVPCIGNEFTATSDSAVVTPLTDSTSSRQLAEYDSTLLAD